MSNISLGNAGCLYCELQRVSGKSVLFTCSKLYTDAVSEKLCPSLYSLYSLY